MATVQNLADLAQSNRDSSVGMTSICSANPKVIEAAMRAAAEREGPLLIEATCNQVNQEGGYTGLTPIVFRSFVEGLADRNVFDKARLIFGGDHLGPNPWRHLPAEAALRRAEIMIDAYVDAGFTKLHLDASMGCAGEGAALPDEMVAARAARLAKVAEAASQRRGTRPFYILGTEVPPPGGARENLSGLQPTSADAALKTVDIHRAAFAAEGLDEAFEHAIGLVVQPGVEFGSEDVHVYDREAGCALAASLEKLPQFVFEAHSTDYQPASALAALVEDGFALLKVGPGLTYAMRQALYGLDEISTFLHDVPREKTLRSTMERLMTKAPQYWNGHYHGSEEQVRRQRHYSYSDRIRYYWPGPEAGEALDALMKRLGNQQIPETLINQYLGWLYADVMAGTCPQDANGLVDYSIRQVISSYSRATGELSPGT